MHTALVTAWDKLPVYTEIETPATPAPDADTVQIKLVAAGLHRVVKSRANGTHYTAKSLPHIPGADGVGTTPDGKLVYFSVLGFGGGSMSELINVPRNSIVELPEGLDPVQIAAFVNPGMSSWMAVKTRTQGLKAGFTAVILGVTTASGAIAVDIVRGLGAGKVVGVARSEEKMAKLGLDERIVLKEKVEETDWNNIGDVDLVLDYLYGEPALAFLTAIKSSIAIQYVQIGSMAGTDIQFPSSLLRSKDLTMRGSGPGAWTMRQLAMSLPSLLQVFQGIAKRDVRVVKLSEVEKVWNDDGERIVFIP